MKKIKYSIAALSLFLAIGCVNDETDFNYNRDRSYDVPAETLLTNAQKELTDQLITPEYNLNPFRYFIQYWAATQYPQESRYNITQRTVADNLWNNLYRDVLGNLETAKEVILRDPASAEQKNKLAIIEILQVYTFQTLVDTFGDVPYSEALQPRTIVLPKYDNDSDIYPALIIRLDAAIANLDTTSGSFTTGDNIYDGDVASWKVFANSLKLKLGITLADANPTLAKTTVESAAASELLVTNAANASFVYDPASPNFSPIYEQLVTQGRNDNVASSTLVNKLQGLSDPRLAIYFAPRTDGQYVGGVNGAANSVNPAVFSQPGTALKTANTPGIIMEASEINFYLAEAASRGYSVGGSADTFYNAAITASFDYWGAADVATYLARPDVAYSAADWKERIGTQAWIAAYSTPILGWTSFRRLDVPTLAVASGAVAVADGKVPVRFTYPIGEATVNSSNLQAAITAMGGNRLSTKIFWDVDPAPTKN